jgi:hypothetical protein
MARNMWRIKFDATLREDVERGTPRTVIHDGEIVWEKDPALLAEWGGDTPDAKERAEIFGGVFDYPYKHRLNDQGKQERVPLVVYDSAPAALRQHAARSLLPEFNPPENRSQVTTHGGAVLIIGPNRPSHAGDIAPPLVTADSPLRRDLQTRLAELRALGPSHQFPLDVNGRRTIPKLGAPADAAGDRPEHRGTQGRPVPARGKQ